MARRLVDMPHPRHIAVLCDGNRRWARENGFNVSHGHQMGALKVIEMLGWCDLTRTEIVTVYALSTENLRRDPDELSAMIDIIADFVEEISAASRNWRVLIVGDLGLLPVYTAHRMSTAADTTAGRTGMQVNVAVGYNGQHQIADAVRNLVRDKLHDGLIGEELVESITVRSISEHLYASGQPDPDLVIRTSGEQRLSGFMLWQISYSELWFTDTYWPDFRRVDFLRALRDYASRRRRFGM
ncbi:polyprenyl diphosphate synthase [Nocardia sp. CA-107356]|uniref:polyprenyl diphosphate synthase n=1 Tax=Nocardia sp. CA-107356 TaxID=3239972 RepID=UPI003D8E480C